MTPSPDSHSHAGDQDAEYRIEVRRLGAGDRDTLLAAASLLGGAPDAAAVDAFLRAPDDHLLLAMVNGTAVGYARAYELRRLEGLEPTLMVLQSRVAETWRRRGVGRALIEALKELGRERSARQMLVFTDTDYEAPLGLFSSTGGIQRAARRVVYEYDLAGER